MAQVLFFGDSITAGYWDVEAGGWVERMLLELHVATWASQKLRWVAATNLGVSGDTSSGLVARLETEARPRLDDDRRLVVVIAIGINDVHRDKLEKDIDGARELYRTNLGAISRSVRDLGGVPLFVGLTPIVEDVYDPEEGDYVRDRYSDMNVAVMDGELQRFCQEGGYIYVPVREAFSGRDLKALFPDGLHPVAEGHELIYQLVRQPILDSVSKLFG